jgi:hypothetical protein
MQFGPVPGTPLFTDYLQKGKLINNIPWKRRHGQDTIWFKHPHFTLPETSFYLKNAFIKKYHTHGPGILNMAYTAIKGYVAVKREIEEREALGITWNPETLAYTKQSSFTPDHFMKLRLKTIRKKALYLRPILYATLKYAPNKESAQKSRMVIDLYNKTFGPPAFKERILDIAVKIHAFFENRKMIKNGGILRQPPMLRAMYKDRSKKSKGNITTNYLWNCLF